MKYCNNNKNFKPKDQLYKIMSKNYLIEYK